LAFATSMFVFCAAGLYFSNKAPVVAAEKNKKGE